MEHFTNYEIPNTHSQDPEENRWSSKIKSKPKELILPCHPYGSISEHKEGMDTLLGRGDLQVEIICAWSFYCRNFPDRNV